MDKKYLDYINLPPHVSKNRKLMDVKDRASQFMPFDALSGYSSLISNSNISSKEKIITLEDKNIELERKLQYFFLSIDKKIKIKIIYYHLNEENNKYEYSSKIGYISSFSDDKKYLYLNKIKICIKDIYDIIILDKCNLEMELDEIS